MISKDLTITKRLGRYHDLPINDNNNDNSSSQSYFNKLGQLYKDNTRKPLLDWDKPLFGCNRTSLEKLLANANKTTERATKFINKIKSRQLACANRAKSIPKNATIRKEYINCGKEICQRKHGPYYYAYWKDPESKKLQGIIEAAKRFGVEDYITIRLDSKAPTLTSGFHEKIMIIDNRMIARFSSMIDPKLKTQVPTTYLITDIIQNARRRSEEGNFDDAVARLYRCLEMVVQYVLLDQYEIFSSDVDLEKLKSIVSNNNNNNETIPVSLLQKLSNKKNERQKVEVGLVEGFETLSVLNREHPVSKEYLTKKESLKQSLSSRNRSILAHRVDPVDKDKYEEMEGLVINFVQRLIPEIEDRLNELRICFKTDIL